MNDDSCPQRSMDVELLRSAFEISDKSPSGLIHKKKNGLMRAGSNAGGLAKKGYYAAMLSKRSYRVHRVIWAIHHGIDPVGWYIDHIDGCVSNNHPSNLRLASMEQNNSNARIQKRNKSGVKGMFILNRAGRTPFLECSVAANHKKYLKRFKISEKAEAKKWLEETRMAAHGKFHNHG